MRSRLGTTIRHAACIAGLAISTLVLADAPTLGGSPVVEDSAHLNNEIPARRTRNDLPRLQAPIRRVAVVGDSMYFQGIGPGARDNTIVPIIRRILQTELVAASIGVENRSRPGLATRYPISGGIALFDWVANEYRPGADNPDLVVLPATSIDLNVRQEVEATALAPLIVEEFERVVAYLTSIGVQAVVVPAFGINDAMFESLKNFGRPEPVRCNANARVNILNDALIGSDLPMLFGTFQGLDQDGDGDVDERNFVGFHAGRYPDDGIHPNGVGEALIAGHIGHRLADALTGAHAP